MSTSPGNTGPLGQPRGIGFAILLYIVTLGFYSWYWVYKTQEEMKQHTGDGLGGVLGLVVWILISAVSAFVIPSEIGRMYRKDGEEAPMSGWTDLQPNEWNHELRWSDTYPERLAHLLAADAVVVLDGGIGTLSEAAVVWAALQTEAAAPDLVFLGTGWPPVLQSMALHLAIKERDLALVTICAEPRLVAAHIAQNRSRRRRTASPLG